MSRKIFITKSHGGRELFSRHKLFSSLRRAGLSEGQSKQITNQVAREIAEGTKTKSIYQKTLNLIKQSSPNAAVHYSLKRSIFDLGPTGHVFELFVAKYFEKLGFKTKTCQIKNGKFVKHEIDVIAAKDGLKYYVECKFHNRVGIKNDIKSVLYVKARWDDLREGDEGKNLTGFYFASNTAFSLDAITYANGTGLTLLGVNAPSEKSFLQEIEYLNLYPVTCLKSLNRLIKNQLIQKNIILASELPRYIALLRQLGMKDQQIQAMLLEIENLKREKL